jgi:hypothetical protein
MIEAQPLNVPDKSQSIGLTGATRENYFFRQSSMEELSDLRTSFLYRSLSRPTSLMLAGRIGEFLRKERLHLT